MAASSTTGSGAHRKTRKSEQTRERILSVAKELVEENASPDIQLAEIAERCGITKSALYYYFEDRYELLGVVFDQTIADLIAALEASMDSDRGARENLEALCATFADKVSEGGTLIVAMATDLAGRAGALQRMESRFNRVAELIEQELVHAQEEGIVRKNLDLNLTSISICGIFLFGAFNYVRREGTDFDKEAFSRELIDLISQGISQR